MASPLPVFAAAVPLNFYALAAVMVAMASAWSGWAPGPMARARCRPATAPSGTDQSSPTGGGRALNMVLPLAVLLAAMPVGLLITGGGQLTAGSGSISALWAVLLGLATAAVLMLLQGGHRLDGVMQEIVRGMEALLGLVVILVLAMALGQLCDAMGTGVYVAGFLTDMAIPALVLPLTFVTAALVAFATGTSWGTFAVMVPIAVSAAGTLEMAMAPLLAAVLSGGIFGDHTSPISDTTVVASLAAGTDVVEHVRTQLPYALLAAGLAVGAFAVTGLLA